MQLRKVLYSIIFSTLLFCPAAKAQSTIKLKTPVDASKFGKARDGYFVISNKNFFAPLSQNHTSTFDYIKLHNISQIIHFKHCYFSVYDSTILSYFNNVQRQHFYTDSCVVNYMHLKGDFKQAGFYGSEVRTLSVDSAYNSYIDITDCNLTNTVVVSNSKDIKIQLFNNKTTDSFSSRYINSKINQFDFYSNDRKNTQTHYFFHDTIGNVGFSSIPDSSYPNYKAQKNKKHIYEFRECHINGFFSFFDRDPDSKIKFIKCTFGPNADLTDMCVDIIEFINCRNLTEKVNVGFFPDSIPGELRIINSDFENIEIVWKDSLKIVFDSTDSKDVIGNTFENLLAKYKSAGKQESYQRVDLQHKAINQHTFFHFIDKIWWHHGYEKYRVFIWSLFFLIFFMILNMIFWRGMRSTYPIVLYQDTYYKDAKAFWAKVKAVSLYTIFIFFALKIDFNKLKTDSHSGYIAWFFFQYLTGLFCLLFIAKAIFQI